MLKKKNQLPSTKNFRATKRIVTTIGVNGEVKESVRFKLIPLTRKERLLRVANKFNDKVGIKWTIELLLTLAGVVIAILALLK